MSLNDVKDVDDHFEVKKLLMDEHNNENKKTRFDSQGFNLQLLRRLWRICKILFRNPFSTAITFLLLVMSLLNAW